MPPQKPTRKLWALANKRYNALMIIITGGAGMIGSIIAWHLNTKLGRDDLVIVDHITHEAQWQNLVHRHYVEYLDKDQLFDFLDANINADGQSEVEAVIHMGAISATTETDFNKLVEANIHYSQDLWGWCTENEVPFFYASSAATYGNGDAGYDDADIKDLRPLNGYGYSKHFFDQWALKQTPENSPPAWAGFKFFNVYGPNEYHKERMASVAFHTFNQFSQTGKMQLFKGTKAGIKDGEQQRDFVYVKDAASIVAYFFSAALTNKHAPNGICNIGTGKARSFKDLATNVMTSMGKTPNIEYIDMPEDLRGKYQYFTEAPMAKISAAGYKSSMTSLEDGVKDYVQNYLMQDDPYC